MSKNCQILVYTVGLFLLVLGAGFLGAKYGYSNAEKRYKDELTFAKNNYKRQLKGLEKQLMLVDMITDIVLAYAAAKQEGVLQDEIKEDVPTTLTLAEAESLFATLDKPLKNVDKHLVEVFLPNINRIKQIRSVYNNDMQSAPEGVHSWRELAFHWRDKYNSLQQ